jgi:uncharacterized Zn finger protein (UPF0148 family)
MLIIICPACGSDLVEKGKNGRIECIKCAGDFEFGDAKYKYVKLSELKQPPKTEPLKPKKANSKTVDHGKYDEFRKYYNKLKEEQK